MVNGKVIFVEFKKCFNGFLKGGVWFLVVIKVFGYDVQVYFGGDLVMIIKFYFVLRVWGGVFIFYGY